MPKYFVMDIEDDGDCIHEGLDEAISSAKIFASEEGGTLMVVKMVAIVGREAPEKIPVQIFEQTGENNATSKSE